MKGLALAAMVVVALPASAQDVPLGFGIQGGIFAPTDKTLKDIFGDGWFNWGITPGVIKTANTGIKIDYDFALTTKSRGGNKVAILRPTVGATVAFGVGNIVPYGAARTGLAYVDYAMDRPGGRLSGKRVVPSTNIEFGIVFGGRLGLSARYDWVQAIDGIGYSGFSIQATYQITKF